MPIYEYECSACGHAFEVMQKVADRPIRKCESCGRPKAKRKVSRTSFVLRGTGWYVTDYAGGKAKPGKEGAGGEDKPSESKPAESKPAESKPADGKPADGKGANKASQATAAA